MMLNVFCLSIRSEFIGNLLIFKVESVRAYRFNKELNCGEWKIHWKEWPSDTDTWEPWRNLQTDGIRMDAERLRYEHEAEEIRKRKRHKIIDGGRKKVRERN